MIETNAADKAKLAGPVVKMSGRYVIAEAIPRPSQLLRPGRNFEFCCNHLLIVVVAWTQHHPMLTECDRLFIMISRNVSDVANRHCHPTIMDAPATCIAAAILSTTCMSWARYPWAKYPWARYCERRPAIERDGRKAGRPKKETEKAKSRPANAARRDRR